MADAVTTGADRAKARLRAKLASNGSYVPGSYLSLGGAERALRRWERAERAYIAKGSRIAAHIGENAKLANRRLAAA